MASERGMAPGEPDPGREASRAEADISGPRVSWIKRRQNKIAEEIERNRRGDYKVPTWVLVVILLALVGGWAAIILLT
jgi:hypothetical protein